MKPFTQLTGVVAPLDRANVDTDQIIPKQFLKSIVRSGLRAGLFFDWRFTPDGRETDFVLNRPPYRHPVILLARSNFGCGSSREHAVWALEDFGIRAVIAPSYGDIFRNNCTKNGTLPVVLKPEEVETLFEAVAREPGYELTIDLQTQTVSDRHGWSARFEIDPFPKKCLLEGLDQIALTLLHETDIARYEASHPIV